MSQFTNMFHDFEEFCVTLWLDLEQNTVTIYNNLITDQKLICIYCTALKSTHQLKADNR